MYRRTVLASIIPVVSAGCTTAYAPSGPRHPPAPGDARSGDPTDEEAQALVLAEWDFLEGEEGRLVVETAVKNTTSRSHTGTIVATATTDETQESVSESVTVDSEETVRTDLEFELGFDEFLAGGDLTVDIEQ